MKKLVSWLVATSLVLMVTTMLLDHFFPFPIQRLTPAPATRVLDRYGQPLRYFLAPDEMWRFPVTLDQVSHDFITALIASEDRYFYQHPGINPWSAMRALGLNFRHGRTISGASTIPMQVARLAEPRPRTWKAKLIEAWRALQLCAHFSKDEILTWYLNLTPYGANVVGVGAASWYYFDKEPRALSLGEIALLTILPRSPTRYNPLNNPELAQKVRNQVLQRFKEQKIFAARRIDESLKRPLLAKRSPLPQQAPHFSYWLFSTTAPQAKIHSTLDLGLQNIVEKQVLKRMPALQRQGIGNVAVVVMDINNGQILAHLGSADFWDADHQGQVDMVLAQRSPGSTLKPLLYALAFDQGHLIPESTMLDVPTDFAGYAPENYGRNYQGLVRAKDALALSLNVPAVRLLNQCGVHAFYNLLQAAGLKTIDQGAEHYGLALALGGCAVRLLDLVTAYAALARGGEFIPYVLELKDQDENALNLFSAEASHLTVDILTTISRPTLAQGWALTRDVPAVAWKTGTSFGHRDAWAIGLSQDLAIGVWLGNADGSACQNISGARHAGPLLFDLFRALSPGRINSPLPPAPGLRDINLCALSGSLPGPFCPPSSAKAIAGVTSLSICSLHQKIFVHKDSGLRLYGPCLSRYAAQEKTIVLWPAELVAYQRAQGMPLPSLPPVHPQCQDIPHEQGPIIQSPSAHTAYALRSDAPHAFQRLALLAAPALGGTIHYWYVDSRYVGQAHAQEPCFVALEPGEHEVLVTDNLGRSTHGRYTVMHADLR